MTSKSNPTPYCWCGNRLMVSFSNDYSLCPVCQTLVWVEKDQYHTFLNTNPLEDYYGSRYWFDHQANDLHLPDINFRARSDLRERCLYWLKTILEHRLPPAKVLELGSSHGGFIALLRAAGFDATGLEISKDIANFARQTFQVPVLVGPIETQNLPPGSFDMIILMDVLEHLDDPIETMQQCLRLLKDDGLLFIQTPGYPAGKSLQELEQSGSLFTRMLIPREHIHLFSEQAIRDLFNRLGATYLQFLPAYYAVHDIYFIVSNAPIHQIGEDAISDYLLADPSRRIILALLDLAEEHERLKQTLDDVENEREEQSEYVVSLEKRLAQDAELIEQLPPSLLRKPFQFGRRVKRQLIKLLKHTE